MYRYKVFFNQVSMVFCNVLNAKSKSVYDIKEGGGGLLDRF